MFGESEDELLNSKRADLVVVDEKCVSLLNERKKMGKARGELTLKRKDGSSFEGEVTSTIFVDADGLEKTIIIVRDITQQKKTEETLRRVKEDIAHSSSKPAIIFLFLNYLK